MSILNGLSAAGAGIAQFAGTAGLEVQKSQLAEQQAVLADQLATTRETTLQGQAQTFQAGQSTQQQQFQEGQQGRALAATASEGAANRSAEAGRQQVQINAPPETIKLLRALGVPLPGATPAASATTPSDGGSTPSSGLSGAIPATGSSSSSGSQADLTNNPIVAKALGLGAPGSEQANRQAIAQGVNADPKFKGATVDQKAAETEKRFAVATSKMASPEDRHAMAVGIASYQLSPLDQRARMMAGGPETTSEVLALNPKYNETNYDAIKETQKAIAPGGSLAVPISAMNTSMGHAAHFLDVAQQLGNWGGGNWANLIPNKIAQNTGAQPLVSALQQTAFAMAEEGNKIYAGNAGTQSAIDNWYKSFPVNGSLADQVGSVKNFAQLMGDKFDTMTSMVNKTFTDSGVPPVELLLPKAKATYDRLTSMESDGKPAVPAASAIPSWAQPGDQYNAQLGLARRADGTTYGAPK